MNRRQYKNTINNVKNNMAPPNSSGSKTPRPKHSNNDETDECDLKNKSMGPVTIKALDQMASRNKHLNHHLEGSAL